MCGFSPVRESGNRYVTRVCTLEAVLSTFSGGFLQPAPLPGSRLTVAGGLQFYIHPTQCGGQGAYV